MATEINRDDFLGISFSHHMEILNKTKDIDAADEDDVDERVVENTIVRNVKRFMMNFGKDFAYVGNQYDLEVFGEEQRNDPLFFNRQLNCLVAVELKAGKFKTAYLCQLYGYLQVLDDQVRKPHENPSIGIILCKRANRAFVEYAVRDYTKSMGVATYKTLSDMPEAFRDALPDENDLTKLL